jgi:hypothetical protein
MYLSLRKNGEPIVGQMSLYGMVCFVCTLVLLRSEVFG